MILLVMGVTGSGKTTVAELLAKRLGWVFLDADDFHSAANKEKMRRGIHLTDADRGPWLDAIHAEMAQLNGAGMDAVLACSALKEEYREHLDTGLPVKIVYLKGSRELIAQRLGNRHGHFAGESILADQFATLEEPEDAIVEEVAETPEQIVEEVVAKMGRGGTNAVQP